ncbi:MAG: hypothetical protein JNM34_11470 [Chthonomonadaceae bacterium]|nr:hypothetical protein [Chthonomonadaceae bacterium]
MRHLAVIVPLLLPVISLGQSLRVLDRTREPLPLLIDGDTDMAHLLLVDNNPSRPAIVVIDGRLNLGGGQRQGMEQYLSPNDPGLGSLFDGGRFPKLDISFSHHDCARAFIVAMGSVRIDVGSYEGDSCALLLPSANGDPGHNSQLKIDKLSGYRIGVMASGQVNLSVTIGAAVANLRGADSENVPGHAFYANECRLQGRFLPVEGLRLRIASARALSSGPVRLDHVTAKFKGTRNLDYECLDDQNPCGAFDQFDSTGKIKVVWKHPGGQVQNSIFTAFRSGWTNKFGSPLKSLTISGSFDCTLASDLSVPSYRLESALTSFQDATLIGPPGDEWEGTRSTGLVRYSKTG